MKYILIFLSSFIVFVANADPLPKDVNVVNTPDVNVVSMPSVEVTVPNALDVNVQNTPGVTIENGPMEPVPVIESSPAGTYFNVSGYVQWDDNPGGYEAYIYLNPSKVGPKVIETVTYKAVIASDQVLDSAVIIVDDVTHSLTIPVPEVYGVKKIYSISIPVRFYEPIRGAYIALHQTGSTGDTVVVSYSGYFLPDDATIIKN